MRGWKFHFIRPIVKWRRTCVLILQISKLHRVTYLNSLSLIILSKNISHLIELDDLRFHIKLAKWFQLCVVCSLRLRRLKSSVDNRTSSLITPSSVFVQYWLNTLFGLVSADYRTSGSSGPLSENHDHSTKLWIHYWLYKRIIYDCVK